MQEHFTVEVNRALYCPGTTKQWASIPRLITKHQNLDSAEANTDENEHSEKGAQNNIDESEQGNIHLVAGGDH